MRRITQTQGGRCNFVRARKRTAIEWDGDEKFGRYAEWLTYIITHFLQPWGCQLNGRVRWEGEDDATGTLIVTDNEVRDEPDEAEPSVDDDVSSLVAVLNGDDAASRQMAVSSLSCAVDASPHAQSKAIDALIAALSDRDLVKSALESLGEIGEPAANAVEKVTVLLRSPDHQVRYWATFALGRFGSRATSAISAPRLLVNDAEYGPRYGAIDALKRLGETA